MFFIFIEYRCMTAAEPTGKSLMHAILSMPMAAQNWKLSSSFR